MKTRTCFIQSLIQSLVAAALVAGFSPPARAQSNVYGINIVGYVSLYFTNGLRFIANPLSSVQTNGVPNNWLTNLIRACPTGTQVYEWDLAQQSFSPPATFEDGVGWDFNLNLPPGKGFVVLSVASWTNTFVGEVLLGTTTNFVAGSNRFSLLASKLPQAGSLSSNLFFPQLEGVTAYLFRTAEQRYSDAFSCFASLGWFDPNGVADIGGPYLNVAESFLVRNPGADTNWIRTFNITPNSAAAPPTSLASSKKTPAISSIAAHRGQITLQIRDAARHSYDIEFSRDGRSWKAVAKNRTGPTWTTAVPEGIQGYYRLNNR